MTADVGWQLVLASASPARLATLRSAGVYPRVQVSAVDEPATLAAAGVRDAQQVPLLLARAKAEDVAAMLGAPGGPAAPPDGWIVLGCDSILDLDGEALGKPADAAGAIALWQRLRGRSGVLRSGHWLIDLRNTRSDGTGQALGTGQAIGGGSVTTVHFADLTDAEIRAYVATGEPLNVAGGFTVDGLGGAFVTGIEGDHHGVVGVSLPLLRELLARLGVDWSDLWVHPGLLPA